MFYRVHYDVGDKEFVRDFFTKESAEFELLFCKDKTLTDGSSYSATKVSKVKDSNYVGGKYVETKAKKARKKRK